MALQRELNEIIAAYSLSKYHIEYQDYLSNHLSHGCIALYHLGASKERILDFVKWYIPKLELRESTEKTNEEDASPTITLLSDTELQSLLGKRREFHKLRDHFAHVMESKYQRNVDEFVRHEFGKLANGMHVAALHPLIHTGYSLDAGIPILVVEGIAYLYFSYMPIKEKAAKPSSPKYDILEVLENIRNNQTLRHNIIRYSSIETFMSDIDGPFPRRVGALLSHPWLRSQLQMALDSLQYPDWFHVDSESSSSPPLADVQQLMDTVMHWALTVYTCAEKRNDFFLLHGVTGAWSLSNILKCFTDPQKALECVQYYILTLFSVYIAEDCPEIDIDILETEPEINIEDIVKETLGLTTDEHVYKLVHICNELSKVNKEPKRQRLYKIACRLAIDYHFQFE